MEDLYQEHLAGFHKEYTEHCSECYKENRIIKAHRTVNIPKIEMPPKDWAKSIINKIIWGDNKHLYD